VNGPACPIPLARYPVITLGHGGGGRLTAELIDRLFGAAFGNRLLDQRHDATVVPVPAGPLAVSTDSFVVSPLSFPGGSIGSLAVFGTANDLAMGGARPLYLTVAFILEEGLPIETLWREVLVMQKAAAEVGASIVAGDTKVVERGKGDGLYLNTTGLGAVVGSSPVGPRQVRPGDVLLVSGDLGRHGMAVMAAREGLALAHPIESDCGSLVAAVLALLEAGLEVHCLRDLTRGGLATALNEVAAVSGTSALVEETKLAVEDRVASACEIFGLDPLYVANEGRFAAWVRPEDADRALTILRRFPITADAVQAGVVLPAQGPPTVTLQSRYGTTRVLDLLAGEQLPRIC